MPSFRTSAPSLTVLKVHFFNQLIFSVPRLLQFIQASENLIFHTVSILFEYRSVRLLGTTLWELRLSMQFVCRHPDWQVASVVQIFDTLSPVLAGVEQLTLSHTHNISSEWHNEVDRTQWRELLRPFSGVKTIWVGEELAEGFSRSLRSGDGEMPLEILPNLLELQCPDGYDDAFTPFILERRAAGHPVRLVLVMQVCNS
jgi:hypothetical protein